jgi:hypothetical protein
VLLPQGRLAGYVIHTPEGLTSDEKDRARDMGPAQGVLAASPARLLAAGGFNLLQQTDVTTEFRSMLAAIRQLRSSSEPELRLEEGDEVFEEAQERKRLTLQCVDDGLLVRSLWVAERVDPVRSQQSE